jgi:hypothetical protein
VAINLFVESDGSQPVQPAIYAAASRLNVIGLRAIGDMVTSAVTSSIGMLGRLSGARAFPRSLSPLAWLGASAVRAKQGTLFALAAARPPACGPGRSMAIPLTGYST